MLAANGGRLDRLHIERGGVAPVRLPVIAIARCGQYACGRRRDAVATHQTPSNNERLSVMNRVREWMLGNATWVRRNWFYLTALVLAVSHALKWITMDWPAISLLVLAGFPIWFPAIVRNIRAVKRTDRGWELELFADKEGLAAAKIQQIVMSENKDAPLAGPNRSFEGLSVNARLVLKTLWHFQCVTFGENDERRWGFGVAPVRLSIPISGTARWSCII